jgi:hypothetical protein
MLLWHLQLTQQRPAVPPCAPLLLVASTRAAAAPGMCCCGSGGRGYWGGDATGSSRCWRGSRCSIRGGMLMLLLLLLPQFSPLAHQAWQPSQVAAVAAVDSRHKVWPKPLLCFSRNTTAVTTKSPRSSPRALTNNQLRLGLGVAPVVRLCLSQGGSTPLNQTSPLISKPILSTTAHLTSYYFGICAFPSEGGLGVVRVVGG